MKRFIIVLFALIISMPAQAQLFKPFSSLRVIKTEHFEIIFPAESEPSARLLATYADDLYKQISSLFDIYMPRRIPVTFAPHTGLFNGYYNSISSPHIVLYDTPMDIEWTTFADNLQGLFIHELVHAISLSTRAPFFRVLHRIFGNWVSPAFLNTPLFMVEGVTVSFESLSGFGRANDPLVKQKLRQAVYEDRFPTPFQVSGVYDYPGQRGNYYEYGGFFSAWLILNYGMDKYIELWQAMGSISRFSFFVYRSDYYSIFKKNYGIDFLNAWNAFNASLIIDNIEDNPDEILPVNYSFFSEKRNSISAISAGENDVYILNGSDGKINIFNTVTERFRTINVDSFLAYDLDVSADERFLLVSGYRLTGDRYTAVVTEHDTVSGRRTNRIIRDLYKARYFRDGVIGISSQLHNNNIVYEDFSGRREVLFRGNEELMFSGPQVLDNDRIIFIAARGGFRELLLYDFSSGELFRIEGSANCDDEILNPSFWHYMRGLGISEGKIFFSHNSDDRMYKLSFIDLNSMQAVVNQRDFSGGVFYPVSVNGSVYYRGAFFSGDGFLRFPEASESISGFAAGLKLVELDSENYGMTINNTERSSAQNNNYWQGQSTPYFSISYMNPFNFWVPLPLFRYNLNADNFDFSFDGAGIFSVMMDPTDRHLIMVFAYADLAYNMAMIDTFTWQTTLPGFPLTMEFSDKVVTDIGINPYRETRVSLNGSFIQYPGRWAYGFSLGAGFVRFADNDGGKNAYEWEGSGNAFFLNTGLLFSNLFRRQHEMFGTGMQFNLRGISIIGSSYLESFKPRFEGIFRASTETRFPLSLSLYGAYDEMGMNIHGASRVYGLPIFDRAASKEYSLPGGLRLDWIAGFEASAGIFSFEIQNNLSHIYFNRFFGTMTLRNVIYDSKGLTGTEGFIINDLRIAQSLVLKLSLVSSVIPIKLNPLFIEPNIWGAWKFSNTFTDNGSPWGYGFNINIRY